MDDPPATHAPRFLPFSRRTDVRAEHERTISSLTSPWSFPLDRAVQPAYGQAANNLTALWGALALAAAFALVSAGSPR